MKSTKKGLFKKLGAGLLVMAAMAPLALGMTSVKSVSAAETDDKVTVSLHKMIRGKDAKDITNTGAELDNLDDYTNWNREDDGDVAFSIYSVDAAFDAWKKKSTTPSYEDDGKAFNAFQQYILNFDGEQDELLADLGVSAPIQTIDSRTSEINDNLFNFTNITNNGKYMILETYIDTDHTTSKAIPTVFSLPLAAATGKTVHLYAKNTVPKTDPELEKKMEDKDQPGEFELKENIEFTLTKDGSTNFEPVEASTDENGILKIKNLSAGNYTLTETEVDGYTPAVIKFKVSQGNISITSSTPDDVTVNQVNGVWTFSVKNYLVFGEKDFLKVDGDDRSALNGAEFYVTNNSTIGAGKYAKFEANKFVGWVDTTEKATKFTSGDTGVKGGFNIPSMPYGTYYLEETKAPDGYAPLDKTISFTISETSEAAVAKEIENSTYGLPITGGMGIWVFVLIGAVLMGGSGYYYYKSRKNKLA